MISKSIIKYIQSLQHKKFRDEYGTFFAEGPKLVNELLLTNNFECESIYCNKMGSAAFDETLASKYAAQMNIIEDFELDKISALSKPNMVLAVFKQKLLPQKISIANKLTLVLDDIQDPGNLGTIIRNADWFGIENIFCSPATADCYNPKVVQSTMASLGRVNMVYGDIKKLLQDNATIKKYAAVLGGNDVKALGKITEGIIIIGNESKGISADVVTLANERITIERIGGAESLNAAVAAGIILFAVV
jgi:RNA methyltransferase, TrmH family